MFKKTIFVASILLAFTSCVVPPTVKDASVLAQHELDVISLVKRGKDYSLSGRTDLAESEFRKALELRPDVASIYNDLGYVLLGQDRLPEAEAMLKTALQLSPKNVIARENLARVLYRRGNLAGSRKEYITILNTVYGTPPEKLRNIVGQSYGDREVVSVYRDLATIYYVSGEYDEAICHSTIAHVRGASEFQAGQHARLLLSLDLIDPAVRVLRDVVIARSGNVKSPILLDYGIALFLEEDYTLSKAALTRLLSAPLATITERRLARLLKVLIAERTNNIREKEALEESVSLEDPNLCMVKTLDVDGYWPVQLKDQITPLVNRLCGVDEN